MAKKKKKKNEEKYTVILFLDLELVCSLVRIRAQGECLRLGLKSRVSRCLSPWSGGSVWSTALSKRFRIQWLVCLYLTTWKEILFLSLEACQRTLSLACFRPTHTQTKRPSVHARYDTSSTSWFCRQRFVEPWQWPQLKTFVRFWWRWLGENGLPELYFYREMKTFRLFFCTRV